MDISREKRDLLDEMQEIHHTDPSFSDEQLALKYNQNRMRVDEINRIQKIIDYGPDF